MSSGSVTPTGTTSPAPVEGQERRQYRSRECLCRLVTVQFVWFYHYLLLLYGNDHYEHCHLLPSKLSLQSLQNGPELLLLLAPCLFDRLGVDVLDIRCVLLV